MIFGSTHRLLTLSPPNQKKNTNERRLEPASELRLDETYVEASMGTLRVPFPDQELFTRPLFVSYLDDDLLVVRCVLVVC